MGKRQYEYRPPDYIYLASPYTSYQSNARDNAREENGRYKQIVEITALLIRRNYLVYSPIVHTHPIYKTGLVTGGAWDSWSDFDCATISHMDCLCVVEMDGWQDSRGMAAEVDFAKAMGIPIIHLPLPIELPTPFVGDFTPRRIGVK